MSLVDSALKTANKLVDEMGNGGIAAVHSSNKLHGNGFELTCLGWAIRGVDPVNLCSWEEVNHVGDGKPDELGFVRDFSYKYVINAIHYYGYPSKLQGTKFFVDELGPLKTKLRENKKEVMKEKMTMDEAMKILKESGKKTVNESYLEEANVEELYELAMKTLAFADQVHCWHWCCQSGFQHTHFESIYDALRDFADELVEVSLASGKNIRYSIQSEMKADSMNFEAQEAVEEIEDFIDTVQATGKKFEDYSEITAVFDDISKTLSKELGLIKNFL